MKIGELFLALGFDVDDKKLDSFEGKIDKLKTNLAISAAKALAAVWAIDKFTAGSIKSSTALANFHNQTKLSVQSLQKWMAVAQMKNLSASADTVLASVKAIQDNLTQIKLGGGNVTPFQMLGIDVRGKDAFSVLEQIREKIKGLDRNVAVNLMQQLGIDPTMLETLQLTREEFDALGNQFIRSQEATDRIMRLGHSINRLKMNFSLWKDQLVSELAPSIEWMINLFYKFVLAIKNIKDAMEKSEGFRIAIYAISAAFGALALAMMPIQPAIWLIAGAVAGLLWAFNDLANFINGKDSFFGKFLDDVVVVNRIVGEFIDKIKWLILHGGGYALGFKSTPDSPEYMGGGINQFTPEQLSLALSRAQKSASSPKMVTVNNTINVEVSGDSQYDNFVVKLKSEMNNLMDKSLGSTLADFNNMGR